MSTWVRSMCAAAVKASKNLKSFHQDSSIVTDPYCRLAFLVFLYLVFSDEMKEFGALLERS
jgi:hypothetical protein